MSEGQRVLIEFVEPEESTRRTTRPWFEILLEIQMILQVYSIVFEPLARLPLFQSKDHVVELIPGARPMNGQAKLIPTSLQR